MSKLTVQQRAQVMALAQPVIVRQDMGYERSAIDIQKRQVTTRCIVPYSMNLNGYRILPEEIEYAIDSFMAYWQLVGRMHEELTNSYPVRVWCDDGCAMMTIQVVDDDDWAKITDGTFTGTSWAGLAMLAQIPPDLAEALFIPPGDWLFDIDWIENSFVDVPAVPEASFYNRAEHQQAAETLVQQALAGKIKPRVRYPEPPAEEQGDQPAQRLGILERLQRFIQDSISNTMAALNSGNLTVEDTDMGLTPEERQELDTLQASIENLSGQVAQLVEAQTAKADPPAEEVEAANAAATQTAEVLNGIAASIDKLGERLTAIENQKAPSAKLREDADAGKPKEVSVSSLPHNDPARKAALAQ